MVFKLNGYNILNVIFPKRCPFCNSVVGYLPACTDCDANSLKLATHMVNKSQKDTAHLDNIAALYRYEDVVKKGIQRIKFGADRSAAIQMAQLYADSFIDMGLPIPDIVVCVPDYKKEHKSFSLPNIMAKHLCDRIGVRFVMPIEKIKKTAKQHNLNLEQRRKNLQDSFAANGSFDVAGLKILLVDDVITSGNTLNEMAKTLKACKAEVVSVYTLASREL